MAKVAPIAPGKFTDRDIDVLTALINAQAALEGCDNKKLAWLLLSTEAMRQARGVEEEILEEVVTRLFPEWKENYVEVTLEGWIINGKPYVYVEQGEWTLTPKLGRKE